MCYRSWPISNTLWGTVFYIVNDNVYISWILLILAPTITMYGCRVKPNSVSFFFLRVIVSSNWSALLTCVINPSWASRRLGLHCFFVFALRIVAVLIRKGRTINAAMLRVSSSAKKKCKIRKRKKNVIKKFEKKYWKLPLFVQHNKISLTWGSMRMRFLGKSSIFPRYNGQWLYKKSSHPGYNVVKSFSSCKLNIFLKYL